MAISWTGAGTSWYSSQNLTGAAPTVLSDGLQMRDWTGLTVIVETAVPGSQTLSGGGTLQAYALDTSNYAPGLGTATWYRVPSIDLAIPSGASGLARVGLQTLTALPPRNAYICYVPNGVTVSAGSTVTVYVLGYNPALANQYTRTD